MRRTFATTVLTSALIAAPLRADVLLDRALDLAAQVQLTVAPTCATAAEVAVRDAARPRTQVKWFIGGLFLPMVFVPVAYLPSPRPSEVNLAPHPPDLHACYTDAYRQEVQRRRRLGAWSGAAGFGMLAVFVGMNQTHIRTTLGE